MRSINPKTEDLFPFAARVDAAVAALARKQEKCWSYIRLDPRVYLRSLSNHSGPNTAAGLRRAKVRSSLDRLNLIGTVLLPGKQTRAFREYDQKSGCVAARQTARALR
jgi:hypothetical protein